MRILAEMGPGDREKLAGIIGQFASRVVALPPEKREEFICDAVGRIRSLYRERHRSDPEALAEAEAFSDQLERWIRETVGLLEGEEPDDPR